MVKEWFIDEKQSRQNVRPMTLTQMEDSISEKNGIFLFTRILKISHPKKEGLSPFSVLRLHS